METSANDGERIFLLEGLLFEWNVAKSLQNLRKHGVSFEEAASTFLDYLAQVFEDPEHSGDEARFLLVGHSRTRRELLIVHVERGERTRIISARETTRGERRDYEESVLGR